MRTEDAKEIVEAHLSWFKWALGLGGWTVTVQYRALESGFIGRCYADGKYQTATISLDDNQIDDREELLDVLRHELLHILHHEFDTVIDAIVENLDSRTSQKLVLAMHKAAQEKTVKMLEYALDTGLGATPGRFVGMASLEARRRDLDDFEEREAPQDAPTAAGVDS